MNMVSYYTIFYYTTVLYNVFAGVQIQFGAVIKKDLKVEEKHVYLIIPNIIRDITNLYIRLKNQWLRQKDLEELINNQKSKILIFPSKMNRWQPWPSKDIKVMCSKRLSEINPYFQQSNMTDFRKLWAKYTLAHDLDTNLLQQHSREITVRSYNPDTHNRHWEQADQLQTAAEIKVR